MDSLYGGRASASFVLKASFESIEAMYEAFKKGNSYTDCWYNEYAIIDTKNKNHPDNGKVFKRGYDYLQPPTYGAIYIGQIVGPSSGTPYFQIDTIPKVEEKSKLALGEYEYRKYPIGKDDEGNYIIAEENEDISSFNFSASGADPVLVPGKQTIDGENSYNDDIVYTWCNIRKDNADADSWFYVGFQIPYLVQEFQVHMVPPYDKDGNVVTQLDDIVKVPVLDENGQEESHPFYQLWDFGIPKGVRGDAMRNLRVMVPKVSDKIYPLSSVTYDAEDGITRFPQDGDPEYPGKEDDIKANRQILVYDYCVFDKRAEGTHVLIYLGDFNVISGITLEDSGTLSISYTHDDPTVFSKKIKWIKDITLNPETGAFKVEYNNGDTPYTPPNLTWVKDIDILDNGTVVYTKTTGTDTQSEHLRWIKNVVLADGKLIVKYNNGNDDEYTVDYVNNISITPDGTVNIIHSTGQVDTYVGLLKTVKSAAISDSGVMTFTMSDDKNANGTPKTPTSFTVKNAGTTNDHHFKEVRNVVLQSGINDDKHIYITYNYNNPNPLSVPIGDPINYIADTFVRNSDYHWFVLYSDPETRYPGNGETLDSRGMDSQGRYWVESPGAINNNQAGLYWQDMGAMKDQSGVMVGLNVTDQIMQDDTTVSNGSKDSILDYLNEKYPGGLVATAPGQTNSSLNGKVVAYSPGDDQEKEFYAFDYNKNYWFYLGKISESGRGDICLIQGPVNTTQNQEIIDSLGKNGIVLQENLFVVADNPMNKLWDPTLVRA